MRAVIRYVVLAAILSGAVGCGTGHSPPDHHNFIVILTDDQQQQAAGCMGNNAIRTPQIDALAARSMQFIHANVVFSLCSPSRAAILTGRYGSANGVLELNSDLGPGEKTFAQYLKETGYMTAISGKWHLPTPPDSLGFDFAVYFRANGRYYGREIMDMGVARKPEMHCDAWCADRSIDFLGARARDQKPFLLFHCTQTPHMDHRHTWPAKDSTRSLYDLSDMPVPASHLDDLRGKPEYLKMARNRTQARKYGYPDSTAIRQHTRDYYAVITEMDGFVGSIIHSVRELGLDDNTYIFFLSDNGWMLGDHGFTSKVLPYQPSTAVPFLVRGPGVAAGAQSALVANIDLAPTMLELAGLPMPEGMHGKSLKPVLHGAKQEVRQALVYEGLGTYGGTKPNLTVINADFRYIATYNEATLAVVVFEELYDRRADPWEMHNLADDAGHQAIVHYMKAQISMHRDSILKIN